MGKVPRLAPSLARSLLTVVAEIRHPNVGAVEGHAAGKYPVAKVPRLAPSLARSLVTVSLVDSRPKCWRRRRPRPRGGAGGEGSKTGAVAGPQLANCVVVDIRHPNVGAVEGHTIRTDAGGEGSKIGAVAGPQFGHSAGE